MGSLAYKRVPHMTTHVCSLVSALLLTVLISRAKAQQYQQYYDMEEDTGEEEDAIIDVSHPEYYDLEDGDKQEDGFLDDTEDSLTKRAWNSHFTGGLGKRAWNSNFTGGLGKRAWNSNFSG